MTEMAYFYLGIEVGCLLMLAVLFFIHAGNNKKGK